MPSRLGIAHAARLFSGITSVDGPDHRVRRSRLAPQEPREVVRRHPRRGHDSSRVPAREEVSSLIALEPEDFVHPSDRGDDYTIIEISMFAGRSDGAKRQLIQELFDRIEGEVGIAPHSVEITITETPKVNWGIRGHNAEDLALGYTVEV